MVALAQTVTVVFGLGATVTVEVSVEDGVSQVTLAIFNLEIKLLQEAVALGARAQQDEMGAGQAGNPGLALPLEAMVDAERARTEMSVLYMLETTDCTVKE